jgi:hypothetical protein
MPGANGFTLYISSTGTNPGGNTARLHSVSEIVDKFTSEDSHGARIQAGRDRAQSGIYTNADDPAHADILREVLMIKGRRFPTCRHCKNITFRLGHSAKHLGEIDHLEDAHAPAFNPSLLPPWRAA